MRPNKRPAHTLSLSEMELRLLAEIINAPALTFPVRIARLAAGLADKINTAASTLPPLPQQAAQQGQPQAQQG